MLTSLDVSGSELLPLCADNYGGPARTNVNKRQRPRLEPAFGLSALGYRRNMAAGSGELSRSRRLQMLRSLRPRGSSARGLPPQFFLETKGK
ncbi:hypothetical protein EYF80_005748 [Liparis tanakae]|uniref:Uncharacterized protein n=1 Tax=Liparis tanakae TaxID=230148 RepID=A0A4Z2J1I6_9TELE|nr:hypothetical protein EYF80_005748 [Liparis tanakae]